MQKYWDGSTKIREPWLIQRAKSGSFSPDMRTSQYLELAYMGSAEFEWGSIPQFQRDLHYRRDKLREFKHTHNGTTLFFIAEDGQEEAYGKVLTKIIDGSLRLKESSGINYRKTIYDGKKALFNQPHAPFEVDVWFDLHNAIAFARDPQILRNLTVTVANSVKYMDEQKKQANL